MGDWTITVHGTGAHHNKDYPQDADKMADTFVRGLREAGHTVHSASFTHGARQKLGRDSGSFRVAAAETEANEVVSISGHKLFRSLADTTAYRDKHYPDQSGAAYQPVEQLQDGGWVPVA